MEAEVITQEEAEGTTGEVEFEIEVNVEVSDEHELAKKEKVIPLLELRLELHLRRWKKDLTYVHIGKRECQRRQHRRLIELTTC